MTPRGEKKKNRYDSVTTCRIYIYVLLDMPILKTHQSSSGATWHFVHSICQAPFPLAPGQADEAPTWSMPFYHTKILIWFEPCFIWFLVWLIDYSALYWHTRLIWALFIFLFIVWLIDWLFRTSLLLVIAMPLVNLLTVNWIELSSKQQIISRVKFLYKERWLLYHIHIPEECTKFSCVSWGIRIAAESRKSGY